MTGDVLDEGLVLWLPAPASETGEDMAELQVHGSPAVIRAVFEVLAAMPGLRLAEPGEFARRAFENGRIDLTAAEGLADLIDAETEAQRRQALVHQSGGFAALCDGWRQNLLEARALTEAAIDFSDEADVADGALATARTTILPTLEAIEASLARADHGEIIRDGFRIVLAGPPNAGKSSLLNALARRDVAIVSPEAGTTRDILEVRLDLGGYAVVIADTAGLRSQEDAGAIEREGMRRALARAADADLVIWLVDTTAPVNTPPAGLETGAGRMIVVRNKVDLVSPPDATATDASALAISALTGEGVPELIERLRGEVEQHLATSIPGDQAIPTRIRHRQALTRCREALKRFATSADRLTPELAAEDLRLAADALGRITGRIDAEEVLGTIFGRFCIGK